VENGEAFSTRYAQATSLEIMLLSVDKPVGVLFKRSLGFFCTYEPPEILFPDRVIRYFTDTL